MASSILYPPVLKKNIVAGVGEISVPVEVSPYNTLAQVRGVEYIARRASTNENVIIGAATGIGSATLASGKITLNRAIFNVVDNEPINIQVRFIDELDQPSEWSNVVVARFLNKAPTLSTTDININTQRYTYEDTVTNLVSGHRVINYSLELKQGRVTFESAPITSISSNTIKYTFKKTLSAAVDYTLVVTFNTNWGFTQTVNRALSVGTYAEILDNSVRVLPTLDTEKGAIQVLIISEDPQAPVTEQRQCELYRMNINTGVEDLIKTFTVQAGSTFKHLYYDYSVEDGSRYSYTLKQRGDYQKVTRSTAIFATFESMMLVSAERTLNIEFDPTVSSFKYAVAEAITPTLGGAYPFVRRNGHQMYRTFTIGGLISFLMDKNNFYSKSQAFGGTSGATAYEALGYGDLEDVAYERRFREEVMRFLYDNQPKLFKSPTEGNIIIKLTNVSFSPKTELGRRIYSFTATATEIAENSYDNYLKYNICSTDSQNIVVSTQLPNEGATNASTLFAYPYIPELTNNFYSVTLL